MKRKMMTGAVLTALLGTVLQFGGCIPWQQVLWGTAMYVADEFLLDNNGVFDLFTDGPAA